MEEAGWEFYKIKIEMMQKLRKLAIFGPIWLLILPNASHGGLLQAAPDEHPRRILAFLDQYLLDKSDD